MASIKEKYTAVERPTLELNTQASATPVGHTAPQSSSVATATRPSRVPPVQQTISQVSLPSAVTEKATFYCRHEVRFGLWY